MNSYTIYLDKEELSNFCSSDNLCEEGYSYEWENENVIHFHLKRLKHSFGISSRVIFVKSEDNLPSTHDFRFFVIANINSEGELNCVVKEINQGDLFECPFQFIPSKDELFSRSKGLLELDILRDKHVSIIGLGSFGSQIAIELAKAGVGKFSLFDFDRVELHNLARHTSYANDLGRLKTDVLYDSIKGKNPYAEVDLFPININRELDILAQEINKSDIVICATDNNSSRFHISKLLVKHKKIGLFGRAITRAEGGDVFKYTPGGPCYSCLIGNFNLPEEEISNEESARRDGRIRGYMSADDAAAIVQVGLSSDIEPICNMMVKLALVELSRGLESGISSLENDFVFNYYLWANRRERNYAKWAEFPNSANRPTIMRWYAADIKKNPGCSICSENVVLDEGQSSRLNYDIINNQGDVNLDDAQKQN